MADGLCLAVEDGVDAVVDIATLTGACLRTLGVEIAGVMGNNADLVEQLEAAGDPPTSRCGSSRSTGPTGAQLDSSIADLTNMGGINAGSITAALFLEEFVGEHPVGPRRHRRYGAATGRPHLAQQGRQRLRREAADRAGERLRGAPGSGPMSEATAETADGESDGGRLPRLDRAGRQQGPAPRDDLPRPHRRRDPPVGGPGVGGRERDHRGRRTRGIRGLPDYATAGRRTPPSSTSPRRRSPTTSS